MDQPATGMTNGWPTSADLDAATAATTATLANPAATLQDVQAAAEHEQAVHEAYLQRPGGDADLQSWAEEWASRYEARTTQPVAGIEAGT
jgi:hypothetical protein